MFTERKALAEMFADLQEEKRQLKANYRTDLAAIEHRMEQVLNRVQRLDDLEREAVDVEGTLHQLAATTKELSLLIPQVSAGQVIEAAAAKIAAEAKGTGATVHGQQAKTKPALDKTHGIERPQRAPEVLEEIEKVLEENGVPMRSKAIEMALFTKYGWKWADFGKVFSMWRNIHSSRIEKQGHTYVLRDALPDQFKSEKEKESEVKENESNGQNNVQPAPATV